MPHKNPADRAAYRKAYGETHRDRLREQHKLASDRRSKFLGVDGEGGNIAGKHQYLYLRAGTRTLETGSDLRTRECLDFLADLPTKDIKYVAYFFTYDVTMILRDLPSHKMRDLLNREGRTLNGRTRHVRWDRYLLDWMPGKEFVVAKMVKGQKLHWVRIEDVGSFFQCSFVKALERWDIAPILRKRIAATKSQRAAFGAVTPKVRLYCKKECEALADLMTVFREVVRSVGPIPLRWEGPGNLASSWLHDRGVPYDRNVPYECMAFTRDAYYGGRFEITSVGPTNRKIYQYDINSAYPAIIQELPCLVHGVWTRIAPQRTPRYRIFCAKAHFSHKKGTFLGTLPIRSTQGNISYPLKGSGVYWSVEINAAKRAGTSVVIEEAWGYSTTCDCKPLEWVGDVYDLRRQVGKTKKGNALKLALNSIYGKFAQSIGNPRWANPIWAGLITAGTRALIIDACSSVPPESILMIATDGIFCDRQIPKLPLSSALGEWELTEHSSIFIIQPGLYLLPNTQPKTRGVPQAKIIEYARAIRKSWADDAGQLVHEIPLNRFLAARQAVHYGRWSDAGTWFEEKRKVSFAWDTKRHATEGHWDPLDETHVGERPAYRPHIRVGGEESVPYAKSIGTWDKERQFSEDQPEEADGLFTTDWNENE